MDPSPPPSNRYKVVRLLEGQTVETDVQKSFLKGRPANDSIVWRSSDIFLSLYAGGR